MTSAIDLRKTVQTNSEIIKSVNIIKLHGRKYANQVGASDIRGDVVRLFEIHVCKFYKYAEAVENCIS